MSTTTSNPWSYDRIVATLADSGLSRSKFAAAVGVSDSTLDSWVLGDPEKRKSPGRMATRLLDAWLKENK